MKKYIFLIIAAFNLFSHNYVDKYVEEDSIKLNKIIIVSDYNKIDGKIDLSKNSFEKMQIIDVSIPNEQKFKKMLGKYLDKQITLLLIEKIKKDIYSFFIKEDFPFILVKFPKKQDITDGALIIEIRKSKIKKIKSYGANYFSNNKIKSYLSVKEGEDISTRKLFRDLVFINQNPFRNVELIYEKGKNNQETNILLETRDIFPLRVYGGYDYTGYNVSGDMRYFVGFNVGTLYFVDHEIDYQYMFHPKIKKWQGHNASYQIPFVFRTKLKLYGNYIEAEPDLASNGSSRGRSYMLSGRYFIPLVYQKCRTNFVLGYEFKRTNNFFSFLKEPSLDNEIDISQFLFGVDVAEVDKYGKTEIGLYSYFSFGDMTKYNKKRYFEIERPGADPKYIYGYLRIDRMTNLFYGFKWMLSFKGQLSSNKLLPSEEFSLGGYYTIRGYSENAIIGDDGIYVKNEIRTKKFSLFKKGKDALELLAFFDYGSLWEADVNIKNRKVSAIYSVGPGLRYSLLDNLSIRFDYGFRLKKVYTENNKNSRAHIGIILSY